MSGRLARRAGFYGRSPPGIGLLQTSTGGGTCRYRLCLRSEASAFATAWRDLRAGLPADPLRAEGAIVKDMIHGMKDRYVPSHYSDEMIARYLDSVDKINPTDGLLPLSWGLCLGRDGVAGHAHAFPRRIEGCSRPRKGLPVKRYGRSTAYSL